MQLSDYTFDSRWVVSPEASGVVYSDSTGVPIAKALSVINSQHGDVSVTHGSAGSTSPLIGPRSSIFIMHPSDPDIKVNITPNSGYEIDSITADGVPLNPSILNHTFAYNTLPTYLNIVFKPVNAESEYITIISRLEDPDCYGNVVLPLGDIVPYGIRHFVTGDDAVYRIYPNPNPAGGYWPLG